MAFLMYGDPRVKYVCSCGALKPLTRVYFCRHCAELKCAWCVSHEVDMHYCSSCLENLPSTEARLKKNRCGYCFDCPSCQNSLSTRAVSLTSSGQSDEKPVSRKLYYLACAFCRWTSREAGVPDQPVATGGWPEPDAAFAKRVAELVDAYQEVALLERDGDELKKKMHARPSYFHYAEKYGLGAAVARTKRLTPQRDARTPQPTAAAVATEELDQLPDELFTLPVQLHQFTTVRQRLAAPELQPDTASSLFPMHKSLLVKRSLRCRECDHNVSKPEFNPSSTKFKIQLSAFYHVPDVKFVTCEPVFVGRRSELILTVCNPTQHATSVRLLPLDTNLVEVSKRPVALSEVSRAAQYAVNGTVKLPPGELQLAQRDDTAEFDDAAKSAAAAHNDDPKLVLWRRGNRIALRLAVQPDADASGRLCVGFALEYTYINTMTALEKKETPPKLRLRVPVILHTGQIFRSDQ